MDSASLQMLLAPFVAIADRLEEQNVLLKQIADDSRTTRELTRKIHWEAERARHYQDTIQRAALSEHMQEMREQMQQRQLGYMETLDAIREGNLSFARFGDGELQLMTRNSYRLRFQPNSADLQAELHDALVTPVPGLMVGMPNLFNDMHWRWVWADIWPSVRPYFTGDTQYGNTHVSRPVFFQAHGLTGAAAWASIWEGKEALIITGEGSRFDMVPSLFGSLAGVKTLHSLPQDAFADMPRVLEKALESTADIILISLGPTGTLLAHKLAREGRQALDIGHLSSSYLNAMEGGAFPEAMPVSR